MNDHAEFLAVDQIDPRMRSALLALFATAWWTEQRDEPSVKRMLAASDVVVGLLEAESNELVGFARAITDRTYLAVVLDVIVHPLHQRRGLGARLLDEMLSRPELADVESIELVCQPELVAFYRRWGFTEQVGRSLLMRRSSNPSLVG